MAAITEPPAAPVAPAASVPRRRFEVATAITLAMAGLLSAWATYQSGLWDKHEAEARAAANARLTEASELMLRAGQEQAMNTAMFLQWVDALADGQPLRADVLEAHFPPTFVTAFTRWRVAQPHDLRKANPEGVLPDFNGPSLSAALAARVESRRFVANAHARGRIRDTYDIANVVLATSLFLAGIATALPVHAARRLPLALAVCLTMATAVVMILTPTQVPAWAILGRR